MPVAIVHDYPIHYKNLLFRALFESGLDFEVVYLASQSAIRNETVAVREERYRSRVAFTGDFENVPKRVKFQFTWTAMCEIRPQVVIIHGYHSFGCWAAWAWARLHRRPIILWFESNAFDAKRSWWKEFPKRWFVKHCALANTYGESSTEYLAQLGLSRQRIMAKGAIVDVARFSQVFASRALGTSACKRLLYLGRLSKEKNLLFLIESLALLEREAPSIGIKLSLVGVGPMRPQIEDLIVSLGLGSHVSLMGYVPQANLPALMLNYDALILPSTYEPWGLVAAEAMISGMPALVSTNCGCVADILTPQTGWRFSPYDKNELLDALKSFSRKSAEELATMGTAANGLTAKFRAGNAASVVRRSIEEAIRIAGVERAWTWPRITRQLR